MLWFTYQQGNIYMFYLVCFVLAAVVAAIFGAVLYLESKKIEAAKPTPQRKKTVQELGDLTHVARRHPLNADERQMYLELAAALPNCIVLAQVALSSLLTTNSKPTRNRFDRKVADFVVCSKELEVLVVVELDDPSDKSNLISDADRDAMIANAGYKMLRYASIPDQAALRKDVAALIVAAKAGKAKAA